MLPKTQALPHDRKQHLNHGLAGISSVVNVTPSSGDSGNIWASDKTSSQFTIYSSDATATDVTIDWHAEM